jgi:DNA-binding MarR family transcriptional regulator
MSQVQDSIPDSVKAFRQVLFLSQQLRTRFDQRLAPDDLTTAQAMALTVANRPDRSGPPSLGEVAAELRTSHQNLAVLLRALQRKGFVEVRADETDRRIRRIVVTGKSADYWHERDEADFAFIDSLFAGVAAPELAVLTQTLDRVIANTVAGHPSADDVSG